jgi:hypothetical protein
LSAEARRVELRELRERREGMVEKLQELRADGREAEAMELKRQIVRLEQEIARRERSPVPGVRPRGEERERPPREDDQRACRQQHLREAIEHLHAAGLPDLAQQVAEEGRERLREPTGPRAAVPREAMEGLHAEITELRESMRRLQAQVEKLSRGKD